MWARQRREEEEGQTASEAQARQGYNERSDGEKKKKK